VFFLSVHLIHVETSGLYPRLMGFISATDVEDAAYKRVCFKSGIRHASKYEAIRHCSLKID